jgi:hypothetical protein
MVHIYSERARASWLPGGQYQRRRSFFYNWWETRYGALLNVRLFVMFLNHAVFARRYTAIVTFYGCFLLKRPPAVSLAEMSDEALREYLAAAAREPGNDAFIYASLHKFSNERRFGRIIQAWGDAGRFWKWLIFVTSNRGTFVVSVPDAPLKPLAELNRNAIYTLTGE